MVYVISKSGKPLMPCKPVIARLLLKEGKARVKHRTPFTIKLLIETTGFTQDLVLGILPITEIIMETASFDTHALQNPEVLKNKWLYQKGINYGFANTKAYILNRDNYTCCHCKGKTKNSKLEVHHIIFRKNGGSDEPENLITLCKTCHDKLHTGNVKLKRQGKKKGNLKHATQMNSIRKQLLDLYPEAIETFGFITKEHRQLMELPKNHYTDAVAIASQGYNVNFKTRAVLLKKCVSDGDYQQTKGVRSEKRIDTAKIHGFKKFDKVLYLNNEYFIKGRMSSGYAILMDIHSNKINLKPIPKFDKMKRISARKSWIISQKTIASF
ncbi:MAG: RRXRR domain-containing protein [Thermodesulfobacteriota bacterium]|nr:RRXRR domain-containing protein [Thermodesulfobacteriota bacterium]